MLPLISLGFGLGPFFFFLRNKVLNVMNRLPIFFLPHGVRTNIKAIAGESQMTFSEFLLGQIFHGQLSDLCYFFLFCQYV